MKATGNFENARNVDPMVVLSDKTRAHIDHWVAKFPPDRKRSAVLQGLHAAQEQNGGWLSDELIAAVAKYLDIPPVWAYEVASFYERHDFPFPGEKHGIYELGARHDWVHVLADYETTPEGELDVFAFIAASMKDHRGLVLLAVTLGLFQNGSIKHVEMKLIRNRREDTLSDAGAIERWADAFRRGAACPVDVMGEIDLFAHKDVPLAEARTMFGVVPK